MAGLYSRIKAQPLALCLRLVLGALLWWVLTEGSVSSWLIGLPTILVAVLVSFQLTPYNPYTIRLVALPGFLFYFIKTSLVAGLDIAKRTLNPNLPVGSQWVTYTTKLEGLPRWLFMSSLSLMPGTLSVSSETQALVIHSLDDPQKTRDELHKLERQLIDLFTHKETT